MALLSPIANLIIMAVVLPASSRNRQLSQQLAVMQYQIDMLCTKNGIELPNRTIPYGN